MDCLVQGTWNALWLIVGKENALRLIVGWELCFFFLKAKEIYVTRLVLVGRKLSFTCVSGVGLGKGNVLTGECWSSYTSKKTAKVGTEPRKYLWHTKQQDIEDCVTQNYCFRTSGLLSLTAGACYRVQ